MIKRLIFDVDSTLITNVNFVDAIKNTLIDLNLYSEERVNDFIKGIGTYEGIYKSYNKTDYTKHMSNHLKVVLPDNFLEVFFSHLKYAIPEKNEKLVNSIRKLAEKYELVLLTNYFSVSQMNRLNGMGIGQYFKYCYGEDLIKPYQDAYFNACGEHRTDECVMIGDDLYLDIECAKELGLKTILVNTKNVDVGNIDTIVVSKVEEIDDGLIETIV